MRSLQPPELISALDKRNQSLPSSTSDLPKEKIIEFKLNISQFSVLDRVGFFKQTSELICSDLINVSVSKENIKRDFRKLESKLKTKTAEKKSLQIKKTQLEKNILECNKDPSNQEITSLMQEKDIEIQALKKKLKMPHETHVQTAKLKTTLQQKESLENNSLVAMEHLSETKAR